MKTEDIHRMAREAGFFDGVAEIVGLAGFARFAELAAAAEREACAQAAEKYGYDNFCGRTTDPIATAIRARGQA